MKKKLNPRLSTSSSYPLTVMKFLEIIFVKYMYIDRYDILFNRCSTSIHSTHTNKSFLRLIFIKSFESSHSSQNFEKTVMTSKTDAT